MSEHNWTPGPWVIDPEISTAEVCTIYGVPEDERTNYQGWAHVRGELGHWDASPDEEMANAHLIAAAPELYEALAEARSVIDVLVKDGFLGYAEQRDAADAALARARGEL